ncbi:MAG: hypothetical protein DA408_08880 [Bacteroidetes bacterium]|nr:MAG: hypothetical protein C7N36_07505 [Bacteroidota bacterium]PTM12832.1 MAG: hypothetical protein DA408_08880 [Bacteroidota bacterium]
MNSNKILIGGLLGGVTAFLLGFLIWGLALDGFMKAHSMAPAGLAKEEPLMWSVALGSLAIGFLFSLIYGRWAGIKTIQTGATAGAVIGGLIGANSDFLAYGMYNMIDMTMVIVDIVAYVIYGALIGAVVGWWMGREPR